MKLPGWYFGGELSLSVCQSEAYLYQFGGFDIVPDVLIGDLFFFVVLEKRVFFYEIAWEFSILKICYLVQ